MKKSGLFKRMLTMYKHVTWKALYLFRFARRTLFGKLQIPYSDVSLQQWFGDIFNVFILEECNASPYVSFIF